MLPIRYYYGNGQQVENGLFAMKRRQINMKKSIVIVMFLAMSFFQVTAFAGTGGGRVTELSVIDSVGPSGPFFLVKTSERKAPSCSVGDHAFAGRVHTVAGGAMFDLIMTALSEGHDIEIVGKGTCGEIRDGAEDIEIVRLRLIPRR